MAGPSRCPQGDGFQQRLREEHLPEQTIQKLEEEGCSNWTTFRYLEDKDIDDLSIPRLQKPTLKKLLRDEKRKAQMTSGRQDPEGVRVVAEDLVDSHVSGISADSDHSFQRFGNVSVEAKRVTRSRVVGVEMGLPLEHRPRQAHAGGHAAQGPPPASTHYWLRGRGEAGPPGQEGGETAMAELQGPGGGEATQTSFTITRRSSSRQDET